jgi:hypothetical protein
LPVFGFASKEGKIHIEIIKKISNQSDRIFLLPPLITNLLPFPQGYFIKKI